jgi:hypothetical protein
MNYCRIQNGIRKYNKLITDLGIPVFYGTQICITVFTRVYVVHIQSPGALYPGVKRPGREADHSLPTSAQVKNT